MEGREQKGLDRRVESMPEKSLEKAKCAKWRPVRGGKVGKIGGGQTVDNLKGT